MKLYSFSVSGTPFIVRATSLHTALARLGKQLKPVIKERDFIIRNATIRLVSIEPIQKEKALEVGVHE